LRHREELADAVGAVEARRLVMLVTYRCRSFPFRRRADPHA